MITEDTRETTLLFQRIPVALHKAGNVVWFNPTIITEQYAVAAMLIFRYNIYIYGFVIVGQ